MEEILRASVGSPSRPKDIPDLTIIFTLNEEVQFHESRCCGHVTVSNSAASRQTAFGVHSLPTRRRTNLYIARRN